MIVEEQDNEEDNEEEDSEEEGSQSSTETYYSESGHEDASPSH